MKQLVRLTQRNAVRLGLLLAIVAAVGGLSQFTAVEAAPVHIPAPSVTVSAPTLVPIGESFSATFTFDNTGTTTGYGPFIEFVVPNNGADGAANTNPPLDGLTFTGANYLGAPIDPAPQVFTFPNGPLGTAPCGPSESLITHPFLYDTSGTREVVCGTPGDQLVVLQLPFGSFTPGQPPAEITVDFDMSNLADLGTPLTINTRGGFQFGNDPLQNPCCDPIVVDPPSPISSTWAPTSVEPFLINVSKTNDEEENEITTGPNDPATWIVEIDVADGQTVTNLDVTDYLPDNVVLLSVTGDGTLVSINGGAPTLPAGPSNAGTFGGMDVLVTIPTVTGTASAADATVNLQFFVPLRDASGSLILDPSTGDDATAENRVQAIGDWTPIDPRDPGGSDNAGTGVCPTNCPGDTVNLESIAIQKGLTTITDAGAPGNTPGDIIEYTLNIQLSDFFAYDNLVIDDLLSDGQRWTGTAPTLSVNGGPAAAMNPANFTFTVLSPGTGETDIQFRVSDEVGGADFLGGCIPAGGTGGADPNCGTTNNGQTIVQVRYQVEIQENFTDTFPSGDPSVDQGDVLSNTVDIIADVLNNDGLVATGNTEDDDSSASLSIAVGEINKSIVAINGSTTLPSPLEVTPEDTVTYEVSYTLPTADFEDLRIRDFPPLPVIDATEITTFNTGIAGTVPPAGVATYGTGDGFFAYTGITPTITSNAADNFVEFNFGSFDTVGSAQVTLVLWMTFTVSDDPFADGLFLTNQAEASEGSTQGNTSSVSDIVQITLREPALFVTKGVTDTDNPGATQSEPDTYPPTFPFGSDDQAADPYDSNVSGVDGGDLVEFTITIENQGGSAAFDIVVSDIIGPGFIIPSGGINLTAVRGDGTVISVRDSAGGTFDDIDLFRGAGGTDGMELVDPEETTPGAGGICQAEHPDDGTNIILITYTLQVDPNIEAPTVIPNTAQIDDYANSEGGPDFIDDGSEPQDSAETEVLAPGNRQVTRGYVRSGFHR